MRRSSLTVLAVSVGLLIVAGQAGALMIAPSPINQRVAVSDLVVVGKVTGFEEKTVRAPRYPGDKEGGEYKIAIIKIDEVLSGAKGVTHIKVGFIPPQPEEPVPPGQIRLPRRRYPSVNLTQNQEVCLFLTSHLDQTFHVAPNYFDMIDKKSPTFAKEVAEAKKYSKLLADPLAGLKAKSVEDRFDTAAMLVYRYRVNRNPNPKTEAIDAVESRLILEALADANWNQQPRQPFQMTPQQVFSMIGLTPKEGWVQPRNFKEFPAAAQKWLKENKDTYRIQRFVK